MFRIFQSPKDFASSTFRGLFVLLGFLSFGTAYAEPIKHRCPASIPNVEIRIVGAKGDKIEVHDLQNNTFYNAHAEGVAEMGGKAGALNCGDVFNYSNYGLTVLRTGWNNDYAHILGFSRWGDEKGRLTIYQYRWLPRDHPVDIIEFEHNQGSPSVKLRNGRNDDRYYRVCLGSTFTNQSGRSGFGHSASTPTQFTGRWLDCNKKIPAKFWKVLRANTPA